jgi:hypothetical protein
VLIAPQSMRFVKVLFDVIIRLHLTDTSYASQNTITQSPNQTQRNGAGLVRVNLKIQLFLVTALCMLTGQWNSLQ